VVVGENKERRKDTATRSITASTSRGREEEERKRNGMGRVKVQVRLGAEAYGLSQVCGVDPDWNGTGASRGGYDPLCADRARHHKSQDQAETALQALLSLVTRMAGLLLGLAIPGLGQKEERKNRRRLLFVPVGGFSDINNMLVICGGDGLLP
jgi:hypothetical protein